MKKIIIIFLLVFTGFVNAQIVTGKYFQVLNKNFKSPKYYLCIDSVETEVNKCTYDKYQPGDKFTGSCNMPGASGQRTQDTTRVKELDNMIKQANDQLNKRLQEFELLKTEISKLQGYLEVLGYLREQELKRQ